LLPSCIVHYEQGSRASMISFNYEEKSIPIWQNEILLRNKSSATWVQLMVKINFDHAYLSNMQSKMNITPGFRLEWRTKNKACQSNKIQFSPGIKFNGKSTLIKLVCQIRYLKLHFKDIQNQKPYDQAWLYDLRSNIIPEDISHTI
jgi:hypothetical protein